MTAAFAQNDTLWAIVENVPAYPNGKFPTLDTIIYNWNNPQKRYDCYSQSFVDKSGRPVQSAQLGEFVDLTQSSQGGQPDYSVGASSVLVVGIVTHETGETEYRVVGLESEFRVSPAVTFVPIVR